MRQYLAHCYEQIVGGWLLPLYEGGLRGRNTFRYRAEFEANQWRSAEEIRALQWSRLTALLEHAAATVPYYREAFRSLGTSPGEIRTPADFARLPILDKATVRAQGDSLLSAAFDRGRLVRSATGGSTGEPMRFYYDRNSYERRIAAAMRGDSWAGWRLAGPEFYVWGVPLLPEKGLIRWKRRLHHACLRREVVNSFELDGARIAEAVRRYNRQRPRVVIGYASALYEFARYVREAKLPLAPPTGIITAAEKTYPHQRELLEAVFGAPVFDRYGCREVMMIAAECERHDGLHVAADNVYVEIVRNGQSCEPGEVGDILLTDLHNYGMPLIRYRVGDAGTWQGHDCACGRGLPCLQSIEGRTLDMITTPEGRIVSGAFFPHLLKDFPRVRSYQVVQEAVDLLCIRLELESPLAPEEQRLLQDQVRQRFGPTMRLQWEMGPDVSIERERKFRPVISRVPVDLSSTERR